jgi:hypothetical protein
MPWLLVLFCLSLAAQPASYQKISPRQAAELFRSVDEITAFVSHETGLPIHSKVKRALVSREAMLENLRRNMSDDPDTQRLRHESETLIKLGLLPRGYSLEKGLLALLGEGVNGYYDEKTQTMNLLDWLPPAAQKPVMAHELTHALQDQNFDLRHWTLGEEWKRKDLNFADRIALEEAINARQAVLEGQGNLVMVDYMLAPTGQSVQDNPQVLALVRKRMYTGGAETPVFQAAPVVLREGMIFPYTSGMDFVMRVQQQRGVEASYGGLLRNPPAETLQIMAPQLYLHGQRAPGLRPADFEGLLGPQWERYDDGAVGALDLRVLLLQWGGDAALTSNWRGGYYAAFRRKNDAKAPLSVAMALRFATPEAAQSFDVVYRAYLKQRCEALKPDGEGYASAEGLLQSEVYGPLWMTTESFDAATAALLHSAMLAAAR